jgi:cell shape-determining protein MreD
VGPLVVVLWAMLACAAPDAAPAWLGIDRSPPDLFVAFAAWLSIRSTGLHVIPWAIVLGLLADCASLDPLGTRAFALGTTSFLFVRRRDGGRDVTGVQVPITVAAFALVAHGVYVLRVLPMQRDGSFFSSLVAGLPTVAWTGLLSWPLLLLLDRSGVADDLTGRRRERTS